MMRRFFYILGLFAFYCWWIEPAHLSVTNHLVNDPEKPLDRPIRALLLTDFHFGRFSQSQTMARKLTQLLRLHRRSPFDLLLLGGDFIDDDPRCLSQLRVALRVTAQFGIPIFAVLGNHDYTSFPEGAAPLIECLQEFGVAVLRNESAVISVGSQRLQIIGIDDLQQAETYYGKHKYRSPEHYRQAASQLDWYARFDNTEPNIPRLVLSHNPDAVYLPGRTPAAVLAGHTHGGQMILLDWISRVFHRWIHRMLPPGGTVTWAGRQTVNGRTLIVSRGMGGAALPLRLLRGPEAIVLTVQ